MRAPRPVRVLVVDDSALIREVLRSKLSAHRGLEVVATAADPYEARLRLETVDIDVVTLDLEMPRMDGTTFLRHLMRDHPLPVVVLSSRAADEAVVGTCLALGAVALVAKPVGGLDVDRVVQGLAEQLLLAARSLPRRVSPPPLGAGQRELRGAFVVVGASTGGTQALETLFRRFPVDFAPVVCVIHMPAGFTARFAARLDGLVAMRVKEAEDGEWLQNGTIYLAPGDRHVVMAPGAPRRLVVSSGPRLFNQRPSVDVLFQSAAEVCGSRVTAVLLTGMGKDGAQGLRALRDAGARTVVQDEATSVVFGMPREAILLGAAQAVLPLPEIGDWVVASVAT